MTKYLKIYWKQNLLLLFLIGLGALAQTLAGILNAQAFNALISFNWNGFIVSMGSIFLALGVYIISLLLRIPYEAKVIQLMTTRIRTDITKNLENTSFEQFHNYQSGTFVSWISNDITTIEQTGYANLYTLITMVIELLMASIALLFFHWSIILFSVIISIITVFLPKLVEKKVHKSMLEMTEEQERFMSSVTNILQGFDTLYSYNLISRITDTVSDSSQKLANKKVEHRKNLTYSAILGALGNIMGQAGVLMLTGTLAFRQIISIGSIAATESLSNTIFNSLGNLTNLIVEIKTVQPIFDKFKAVESIDESSYDNFIPDLDNGITLNNVTYNYNNRNIWEKLNYRFKEGGKYAVVGSSGSGKTTLLNILNGKLTDYEGSVQINGNEVAKVNGKEIRQRVMYFDQTPYIFEGTILDNITLNEEFSEDEIWLALEESGLDQYVKSLPDGLHTSVGENGRFLSGGQKQRLALARGLIRRRNIILIDEGTSSLDEDTALKIEENLVDNERLTIVMITHHLRNSIKNKLDGILNLSKYNT